jgi:hypothetical protein
MQNSNFRLQIISILSIFLFAIEAGFAFGKNTTQDQASIAPHVSVTEINNSWLIKGKRIDVLINKMDLQITVKTDSAKWDMLPTALNDLYVSMDSKQLSVSLIDASVLICNLAK